MSPRLAVPFVPIDPPAYAPQIDVQVLERDPGVGGDPAGTVAVSSTISQAGVYRVRWSIQGKGGAMRRWNLHVRNEADASVRSWNYYSNVSGVPVGDDMIMTFEEGWDIFLANVDALADADVTLIQIWVQPIALRYE